jgi:hypothetical protein
MKMRINEQKIRILALICFLGLQSMPVKANANEWMNLAMVYLMENKPLAMTVTAIFSLCMGGFIWKTIDVKRKADRVEEILHLNGIEHTGGIGIYGEKLMIRKHKMENILLLAQKDKWLIESLNEQQEAFALFAIPAVKQECFNRQELGLEQELKESNVWQRNEYANCGQKLMGQQETQFKVSCLTGLMELNIPEKKEIKDKMTPSQRRYAGLKAACLDPNFIGKENLPIWLKNTTRLKTALQQISNELALKK